MPYTTVVTFTAGDALAAAEQAAIHFSVLDVLAGPLPDGFDVVICSLFLHHLAEEQAVLLLQAMAKAIIYFRNLLIR
jgi:2-polyprenyl-3-methyl-5-hydroxy-6-metoxy-1,4-benzoquinol methylase